MSEPQVVNPSSRRLATYKERVQIKTLRDIVNKSVGDIWRIMTGQARHNNTTPLSVRTIYRVLDMPATPRKPRRPNHYLITEENKRFLINFVDTNLNTRHMTASELLHASGLIISEATLRRILSEEGLKWRVPRTGVYVSERSQQRRLKFARDHLPWTHAEWENIIFADESYVYAFN